MTLYCSDHEQFATDNKDDNIRVVTDNSSPVVATVVMLKFTDISAVQIQF